jgi:hypothetical protein
MSVVSSAFLSVFVAVVFVDFVALLLDFVQLRTGGTTITQICKRYPVIGYVVVGWQILGAVSLGVHLVTYSSR